LFLTFIWNFIFIVLQHWITLMKLFFLLNMSREHLCRSRVGKYSCKIVWCVLCVCFYEQYVCVSSCLLQVLFIFFLYTSFSFLCALFCCDVMLRVVLVCYVVRFPPFVRLCVCFDILNPFFFFLVLFCSHFYLPVLIVVRFFFPYTYMFFFLSNLCFSFFLEAMSFFNRSSLWFYVCFFFFSCRLF
jgi:hypothetical protein